MNRLDGSLHDGREQKVYVRVLYSPTQAAQNEAQGILAEINKAKVNNLEDIIVDSPPSQSTDRATMDRLEARLSLSADVWLVISSDPLDSAPRDYLVVPVRGDPAASWSRDFASELVKRNIRSVEYAYQFFQARNIACVVYHDVPWATLLTPVLTNVDDRATDARAVVAAYQTTMSVLKTAGVKLTQADLDRIHTTTREQLAKIGGCRDDIIPEDLRTLIDDEDIRKFLSSAFCVEQLVKVGYLDLGTFDFALIGSGLWRAFERALNLSVVAVVRHAAGIITTDSFTADGPQAKNKNSVCIGQEVNGKPKYMSLSKPDESNPDREDELQGFMLGNIENLLTFASQPLRISAEGVRPPTVESVLRSALSSAVGGDHKEVLIRYALGEKALGVSRTSDLISAIKVVTGPRNEGSHAKPLSEDKYKAVCEILLGQSHLANVLRLVPLLGVTRSV